MSTGADQPRTASHTTTAPTTAGSGVAGPRREHPAEAAGRAHGDRVAGHVAAQDEAGEPAAAQHADAGVAELVDEGDAEAQHAPDRVDRHGDEGRDEHDDHRGARTGRRPGRATTRDHTCSNQFMTERP